MTKVNILNSLKIENLLLEEVWFLKVTLVLQKSIMQIGLQFSSHVCVFIMRELRILC